MVGILLGFLFPMSFPASLCEIAPSQFAQHVFGGARLGDARRTRRLLSLAQGVLRNPGLSFCSLYASSWGDCKAAYRLMSNPAATPQALLGPHFEKVRRSLVASGPAVVLIEDTSEIDYTMRAPIEGLSRVGPGNDGHQGFLLHSVIAAALAPGHWDEESSSERAPVRLLGFAHQEYFLRSPEAPPSPKRAYNAHEDRESQLFERSTLAIGPCPAGTRFIRVADRGADIYLVLARHRAAGHDFVVRAKYDRHLAGDGEKEEERTISGALAKAPWCRETFPVSLRARPGQAARTATVRVRMASVRLAPSRFSSEAKERLGLPLEPIACTVVHLLEEQDTAPLEPACGPAARLKGTRMAKRAQPSARLEWKLLVSWPVETFAQAREAAHLYATRWIIEEFHRVLKEGMGAERLQMETGHALMNTVALLCPLALRVVDLRERSRLAPQEPAGSLGLSAMELRLLEASAGGAVRTVEQAARAIGRLGGHLGRKSDGMPGARTLLLGWRKLQHMLEAIALLQPHPPASPP